MFPSHPTLSRFAPVNLRDPINRRHPLNRGRIAWWLTLPGWYGGRQFYDLCGPNHGTLTNGPLWQPTTRPGGRGQVAFDGVDDSVPTTSNVAFGSSGTVAFSLKPTAATSFQAVACCGSTFGACETGTGFYIRVNSSSKYQCVMGNGAGGFNQVISATSVSAGSWVRLLLAWTPAEIRIYLNGLSDNVTMGTLTYNLAPAQPFRVGGMPAQGNWTAGAYDDVSIWTARALSAGEARADYDQSRRGQPDTLNRVPLSTYGVPETLRRAGGFLAAAF